MQTKTESIIEAITNIVVGYIINVGLYLLLFPLFGIKGSLGDMMGMGLVFTVVSIVRTYGIRRMFNGKL